jgi:hypothetical protein
MYTDPLINGSVVPIFMSLDKTIVQAVLKIETLLTK